MALATRRKPTVHHKKRLAQHHRHSQPYLKTYWPYLPMLTILGGGAVINRSWTPGLVSNPTMLPTATTRLQAVSGMDSALLTSFVLLVATAALVFFLARHALAFHKVVVRGEHFINTHPLLDIAAVLVFTGGFILTNTIG